MNATKFILHAVITASIVISCVSRSSAQQQIVPEAIVGLDHIPLVVSNLEIATATYRAMGFTITPGVLQANGIRSNWIKFADGSGFELITAREAVDDLTTNYRTLLEVAERPAFFSFHARDTRKLTEVLEAERVDVNESNGRIAPRSNTLNFLSFKADNPSSTASPAHLAHANGASMLGRIWIATDKSNELQQLLVALGGEATNRVVYTPDKTQAKVVAVNNGEVVIMPKSRQLTKNRPVIGATVNVGNIEVLERRLLGANIEFTKGGNGNRRLILAPAATHGLWLEFRE